MAPKKKRTAKRRSSTDALLKESLVAALRRDATNEQWQTNLLGKILGELSLIRAVLEHEASKYNLPASRARRKGRAIK
jgi:hypothetical protein